MNGKYDLIFALVFVAIWVYAGFVLISCDTLSPRVANREAEDHATTDGPATHTETEVHAGRDAITHTTTIVQSTPWLLSGISMTGWIVAGYGRRLRDRVAKAVVETTEECKDCKEAVWAKHDHVVNEYVERVIHRKGKKPHKGKG